MEKKSFETWKPGSENEKEKTEKALEQIRYEDYLLNKKYPGNIDNAFDEDSFEAYGGEAVYGVLNSSEGKVMSFEEQYPDYLNPFSQDEEYQELSRRIKMLQLELIHGEGNFMSASEVDEIKKEIKIMEQRQKDIVTRSTLFQNQKGNLEKN